MSDPVKFKTETFTLFAHDANRKDERYDMDKFIDRLPVDKVYHVKVIQGEEGRREVANRLYQSIIGQVSAQMKSRSDDEHDHDPSVIAGKLKFHILLPMKAPMAAEFGDDALRDESELESALCDMIAGSDAISVDNLYPAYDRAIRSKTLKIRPFAHYLNRVIERLTIQGFVIRLKPSEQARVIGDVNNERKAA